MSIPIQKATKQPSQSGISPQICTPKAEMISLIAIGILSGALAIYGATCLVALPLTIVTLTISSGLISLVSFIAAIYIGFISPRELLNQDLQKELKSIENWYSETKKSMEDCFASKKIQLNKHNDFLFEDKKTEIEDLFFKNPAVKGFKDAEVSLREIEDLLQTNLQELQQVTEKITILRSTKEDLPSLQTLESTLNSRIKQEGDRITQAKKLKALADKATKGFAASKDSTQGAIPAAEDAIQDLETKKAEISSLIKSLMELEEKEQQLLANIENLKKERTSATKSLPELESPYLYEVHTLETSIKKLEKAAAEDLRITIEYEKKRLQNALRDLLQEKERAIQHAKTSLKN